MLEVLAGTGLAAAAGLNAYIPLLTLGLAGRFLDFVVLPDGWTWLSNEWVLVIMGVLLLVEIVADKIPVVDTINDWLQTIVRPAAGGIVFGTGSSTETAAIADPAAFFASNQWVPIAIGIVIALATHLAKMAARPVLNAVTFGTAAPVISAAEDASSLVLSVFAILVPLLVILALVGIVVLFVVVLRRSSRKRRLQTTVQP